MGKAKSNEHSKRFEKLQARYAKGYVTKEQLHRYVELGAITPEEYEEITGEVYE